MAVDVRYRYARVPIDPGDSIGAAYLMNFLRTRVPLVQARMERQAKAADTGDLLKRLVELQQIRQDIAQSQNYIVAVAQQAQSSAAKNATEITVANIRAATSIEVANEQTYREQSLQNDEQKFKLDMSKAVSTETQQAIINSTGTQLSSLAADYKRATDPQEKGRIYGEAVQYALRLAQPQIEKATPNSANRQAVVVFTIQQVEQSFNVDGLPPEERFALKSIGSNLALSQTNEDINRPYQRQQREEGGRAQTPGTAVPTLQPETAPSSGDGGTAATASDTATPAESTEQTEARVKAAAKTANVPPYVKAGDDVLRFERVENGRPVYSSAKTGETLVGTQTEINGEPAMVYRGLGGTEVLSPGGLTGDVPFYTQQAILGVANTEAEVMAALQRAQAAEKANAARTGRIALDLFDTEANPLQAYIDSPGFRDATPAQQTALEQALVGVAQQGVSAASGRRGDQQVFRERERLAESGVIPYNWLPSAALQDDVLTPAKNALDKEKSDAMARVSAQATAGNWTAEKRAAEYKKVLDYYQSQEQQQRAAAYQMETAWASGTTVDLPKTMSLFSFPDPQTQERFQRYVEANNAKATAPKPPPRAENEDLSAYMASESTKVLARAPELQDVDQETGLATGKAPDEDVASFQAGRDVARRMVESWSDLPDAERKKRFDAAFDGISTHKADNPALQRGVLDYLNSQREAVTGALPAPSLPAAPSPTTLIPLVPETRTSLAATHTTIPEPSTSLNVPRETRAVRMDPAPSSARGEVTSVTNLMGTGGAAPSSATPTQPPATQPVDEDLVEELVLKNTQNQGASNGSR